MTLDVNNGTVAFKRINRGEIGSLTTYNNEFTLFEFMNMSFAKSKGKAHNYPANPLNWYQCNYQMVPANSSSDPICSDATIINW